MATEHNMSDVTPRGRYFDDAPPDDVRGAGALTAAAEALPYDAHRSIVGASEVLKLRDSAAVVRGSAAWQDAAWDFVDQIGELKFAFNLVAQVTSRAILYPAFVTSSGEIPVNVDEYMASTTESSGRVPTKTRSAVDAAHRVLEELKGSGEAEILRRMALNLSIPGELYILRLPSEEWIVASSSEFRPGAGMSTLTRSARTSSTMNLPDSTYSARIWRPHPRWYRDADSSMLGVLDSCEKIVMFDKESRTHSRSRLNAGVIVVPNGMSPLVEGEDLATAIAKLAVDPVENESSAQSVAPLILQGPPEHLDKVQRIDLGRKTDPNQLAEYEAAIDRMLAGVDIPKDIVSGLADVKYSNALVIDDALYKAHIETLLLLICDSLTSAYFRPMLRKAGVDEALVQRMVIWYNPSQIVTRPDRSNAATTGYEKYLLSGEAWRGAQGFADTDAPGRDEIIMRLALGAQIPPEIATVLIESLNPEFFSEQRQRNQQEAGVPSEVSDLLSGAGVDAGTGAEANAEESGDASADDIPPGGTLPPSPEQLL